MARLPGHSAEEIEEALKILYDVGIQNCYAITGKAYVPKQHLHNLCHRCRCVHLNRQRFSLRVIGICDTRKLPQWKFHCACGAERLALCPEGHRCCCPGHSILDNPTASRIYQLLGNNGTPTVASQIPQKDL